MCDCKKIVGLDRSCITLSIVAALEIEHVRRLLGAQGLFI